ncbi:MAG TPA: hypothetical protein VFK13_14185 [Gemmatimonadaceae bacterium]|nr:hypothetical protein [Gemmatimonadaceae bacterium]
MPVTIAEWLESRTPRPPAELAARLGDALGAAAARNAASAYDAMLDAAERMLAELTLHPCVERGQAMELLTADALITYAFESAAEAPEQVAARARQALVRLAALAPEGEERV